MVARTDLLARTEPNPAPVEDESVVNRTRARCSLPQTSPRTDPVAHRTRSRQGPSADLARLLSLLIHLALPVLDTETGQTIEHCQLWSHPKYNKVWNKSYANELSKLFQGVGQGEKVPKKQRMAGTDTFHVIKYNKIPVYFQKEITYTKVVC